MKPKFIILLVCTLITGLVKGQHAQDIIEQHIKAIGGREAWNNIKTMRSEATLKSNGAEIKLTFIQSDKKGMRQNISFMGMEGYSILTPTEGWNFMPFQGQTKPEPMTADEVKKGQDGLRLGDAFITYKELGKTLEYLGTDDMDGTECHKFKMIGKEGEETTYYLDAISFYIIKESQKVNLNEKQIESSTLYSNYTRLPEGVIFPMAVGSSWGGETIFTKIEINPKLEDAVFKLPK
jgi:hypothetical protein